MRRGSTTIKLCISPNEGHNKSKRGSSVDQFSFQIKQPTIGASKNK